MKSTQESKSQNSCLAASQAELHSYSHLWQPVLSPSTPSHCPRVMLSVGLCCHTRHEATEESVDVTLVRHL